MPAQWVLNNAQWGTGRAMMAFLWRRGTGEPGILGPRMHLGPKAMDPVLLLGTTNDPWLNRGQGVGSEQCVAALLRSKAYGVSF